MNFRISFLAIKELSHFRRLTSNLFHSIIVDGKRIFEKNALSINGRKTNSMLGQLLMAEGHSIQLGSGGRCEQGQGNVPDNNNININNILGIS